MKIYIVGGDSQYINFIDNAEETEKLEDADIVLFTGGEDVDPSMYGCKKHPKTFSNIHRDLREKEIFDKIRQDQLAIGVCRGSQFLCVMNGGLLIQDVNGHALFETHPIYGTRNNTVIDITSTHHQMQYPFNLPNKCYDILYSCRPEHTYSGDKIITVPYEPEIVYYHRPDKPKCLAIQGHPEYMRKESAAVRVINSLIDALEDED